MLKQREYHRQCDSVDIEGNVRAEIVLFLIEPELLYIFSINTPPLYDRPEGSVMDVRAERPSERAGLL